MVNPLIKRMRKILEFFVVGKGICGTFKMIWNGFWKEIDRIISLGIREIYKRTIKIQPNKVFFFTQESRYTCNPKYICEELLSRNMDIDIVWRLPKKGRGGIPDYVRGVRPGTLDFYKEVFSSKIMVANSYIFKDQILLLKKEQILIQTWHGSLGIKNFGKKDMKGMPRQKMASIISGKMSTFCITNSDFVSWSLGNTFWPKTPKLMYGHPRNDYLLRYETQKNELKHNLCEKWGLDNNVKFVMYGPTFRDSKTFDCYNIDFVKVVEALKQRFGGEWCVLLRYHPAMLKAYERNKTDINSLGILTVDVTKYVDMQELVGLADIAITDYSSWIFDFVLTRKPGFIFATDMDLYNNERGFNYPLETTPFPLAKDNIELIENIYNFDNKKYLQKVETFLKEKGCIEDGHASERVVDKIIEIINEKREMEK